MLDKEQYPLLRIEFCSINYKKAKSLQSSVTRICQKLNNKLSLMRKRVNLLQLAPIEGYLFITVYHLELQVRQPSF